MKHSRLAFALAALALASQTPLASAQLTASVGPTEAPLGGRVAITMSNDSGVDYLVGQACPYNVRTLAGSLVYSIDCPTFVATPLPAGEVLTFYWEQLDDTFSPVPAGDYVVDVELPDGTNPSFTITIGGTPAGITMLGAPLLGASRALYLSSPGDPGELFGVAASGSTAPGIPTCAGTIPLFPDGVFLASLQPSGVFQNFTGALDGLGTSTSPVVSIPTIPSLAGASLSFDFLVLDLAASCPIQTISSPLTVVLQ